MTDDYDFPGLYCNLLNKCKIKQYVDLMQKKYITYWNHTLQHSQTLTLTLTTIYHVTKDYAISAIVTELTTKLTFY